MLLYFKYLYISSFSFILDGSWKLEVDFNNPKYYFLLPADYLSSFVAESSKINLHGHGGFMFCETEIGCMQNNHFLGHVTNYTLYFCSLKRNHGKTKCKHQ